jgi:hypothetical protein
LKSTSHHFYVLFIGSKQYFNRCNNKVELTRNVSISHRCPYIPMLFHFSVWKPLSINYMSLTPPPPTQKWSHKTTPKWGHNTYDDVTLKETMMLCWFIYKCSLGTDRLVSIYICPLHPPPQSGGIKLIIMWPKRRHWWLAD